MKTILILLISLQWVCYAESPFVTIPIKTIKKPASDLIDKDGKQLDAGQAAYKAKKGLDLSTLDPAANRIWTGEKQAVRDDSQFFPSGSQGVTYVSTEGIVPVDTAFIRVKSVERPDQFFRLNISYYQQSEMMRAALMRKLGYLLAPPQLYRDLKVNFKNAAEKKSFLETVQREMSLDLFDRKWIKDEKSTSLVLAISMLEPQQNDYYDFYTGLVPLPQTQEGKDYLSFVNRLRAFRSLLIPMMLVDVPESINRYSPRMSLVTTGFLQLYYRRAQAFEASTYEDLRWIVRRLGQLTEADLREVVRAAQYPKSLEDLVYTKLVYRTVQSMEVFNVRPTVKLNKPNINMTSDDGVVVEGKVVKEYVEGFPQRFSHGDPESWIKDDDIYRVLGVQLKTSGLQTIIDQLNQQLEVLSVEDAANSYKKQLIKDVTNHYKSNPYAPYERKIRAWGGPIASVNVNASRSVTTGTYYGSDSPIQLVDSIQLAGSIGAFAALDGIPAISPLAGANLGYARNYIHVRPLLQIEQSLKDEKWTNLFVPQFMKQMANLIEGKSKKEIKTNKESVLGQSAAQISARVESGLTEDPEAAVDSFDSFFSGLRNGEVFTITDSIATSAYLRVVTSIDMMMGISPLNFMNSISLGVDGSRVILTQTQFTKTSATNMQVFVRKQNSRIRGVEVDANFFLNLMTIRAETKNTDLHTDAFVIDYDTQVSQASADSDDPDVKQHFATREKLKRSMIPLFRNNSTELLYKEFQFQKFAIDHQLKTNEARAKMMMMRNYGFSEDHTVKIQYPRSPDAPELDPKDEEVIVFQHRRGELVGMDILGFALDALNGLLKFAFKDWGGAAPSIANDTQNNPANTPFGKAYWRIMLAETDLTPNGERLPNVGNLQHVWGGWKISKQKLFKLFDEIENQFDQSPVVPYKVFDKAAYALVKQIDFYRITAQLTLLPSAMDNVKNLVLQPDSNQKPGENSFNIFKNLSELLAGKKYRPGDKAMFEDIVTIMGNGNYNAGLVKYADNCRKDYWEKFNSAPPPGNWYNGTNYECLSSWMQKLIDLASEFPSDQREQVRWMTKVVFILDEQIPLPQIMKVLGEKNFIFQVSINGFKTGDEDGDTQAFSITQSNVIGDPDEGLEYINGLVNYYALKTRLSPLELDRSQASFK
ncbi:MAG: hypothetical protein ACK5P5_05595 [Pseudobdellovibrionaceae bacterium]